MVTVFFVKDFLSPEKRRQFVRPEPPTFDNRKLLHFEDLGGKVLLSSGSVSDPETVVTVRLLNVD
jgi:hypothetical protein